MPLGIKKISPEIFLGKTLGSKIFPLRKYQHLTILLCLPTLCETLHLNYNQKHFNTIQHKYMIITKYMHYIKITIKPVHGLKMCKISTYKLLCAAPY